MIAQLLIWSFTGYLLGSIPFSLIVGQLFCKKDIRTYGDGNPGAYNAWHTGGWPVGLLAIVLDVGKGILPIYFAREYSGLPNWGLLIVALSPILGHIFTPFLHFHGGKAVATTLGVWVGLTGLYGIVAFAAFVFLGSLVQQDHAWFVINGMLGIVAYLLVTHSPVWLIGTALINGTLMVFTHHRELSQPIQFKENVKSFLARGK